MLALFIHGVYIAPHSMPAHPPSLPAGPVTQPQQAHNDQNQTSFHAANPPNPIAFLPFAAL